MREIFKRTINSVICSSIIACIIGFIMAINPSMSIKTISIIASIYIIIHGIILISLDIKASRFFIPFDGFLPGILSIVLGIFLIGKPDILSTVFTIVIGVWIVISSINTIKISLVIKGANTPWFLLLLLGIIDVIAGTIVIFNPFEASMSITVFAGIMIMVHSIINIVDMMILKKDIKNFEKAITEKLKIFK